MYSRQNALSRIDNREFIIIAFLSENTEYLIHLD